MRDWITSNLSIIFNEITATDLIFTVSFRTSWFQYISLLNISIFYHINCQQHNIQGMRCAHQCQSFRRSVNFRTRNYAGLWIIVSLPARWAFWSIREGTAHFFFYSAHFFHFEGAQFFLKSARTTFKEVSTKYKKNTRLFKNCAQF